MSSLDAFDGADWSEPPRGLIRSVMDRHDITERQARLLCGLEVADREMRAVGRLPKGTLFWHNCFCWQRCSPPAIIADSERFFLKENGKGVWANVLASKARPEQRRHARFHHDLKVNCAIPEEVLPHLPD